MDSPFPEVVERLAAIIIHAMDAHTLAYNEHERVETFIARAVLSSPIISDLIAEARAEEREKAKGLVEALTDLVGLERTVAPDMGGKRRKFAYMRNGELLADCLDRARTTLSEYQDGFDGSAHVASPAAASSADGWQPIETAPRDGTRFLWCADGGEYTRCRWSYSVVRWPEYKECFSEGHWMPLPAPPTSTRSVAEEPCSEGVDLSLPPIAQERDEGGGK